LPRMRPEISGILLTPVLPTKPAACVPESFHPPASYGIGP
jgi:hypothetical protein